MVEENSQEPLPPAEGVLWRRAWSRSYHFERAQTSLRARIIFSIMEENRREEPAPAAEEENKREEPEEQLPASEISGEAVTSIHSAVLNTSSSP